MPRCPVCGGVFSKSGYTFHLESYIPVLLRLGLVEEDAMRVEGCIVRLYRYGGRWYLGPSPLIEAVLRDHPELRSYLLAQVKRKIPTRTR